MFPTPTVNKVIEANAATIAFVLTADENRCHSETFTVLAGINISVGKTAFPNEKINALAIKPSTE